MPHRMNAARSLSRCGTAGGVGLTRFRRLGKVCRRSSISDLKVGEFLGLYAREGKNHGDDRFVWNGVYPKFTSDIPPNRKDMRTRVRVCLRYLPCLGGEQHVK